jgi:hypothetical protein
MASLRMMEQYAVILTRYPVYQPYTDADEWTLNFYESRRTFPPYFLTISSFPPSVPDDGWPWPHNGRPGCMMFSSGPSHLKIHDLEPRPRTIC